MARRCRVPSHAIAVVVALLASAALGACSSDGDAPNASTPTSTHAAVSLPAAADSKHAWAVGMSGSIFATTDGCRHWRPQTSETSYALTGITFADNEHGWAIGSYNGNATDPAPVLATSDGGAHWARQTVAEHFLPSNVACVDASHAWVAGSGSSDGPLIAATNDGGAHWVTQLKWSQSAQQIFALAFADSLHGWAIADYRTLLATRDGGLHWSKQTLPKGYQSIDCIACPGASHCLVGGSHTKGSNVLYPWLAETTDGGTTWRSLPVAPIGSDPIGALYVLGARWMLVGSYDRAWTSPDKAAHLTHLSMPAFTSFAFADSKRGWCVAGHAIWTTTDGGRTWRRQYEGTGAGFLQAVACGRPQTCSGPTEPN